MEFRKDINGLRCFAVLSVLLYHFGFTFVQGGFIGVDVFFVISGFLMTGIIFSRHAQGRFSLKEFYIARVRRIVPALGVMVALLLAFGWFYLIPSDYQLMGRHGAGSALFYSNFVYKGEDGYFDVQSRDKWMLHTWSLATEWQFYLIYPLMLMAFLRRKAKPYAAALAIVALAAISFAGSALLSADKSSFCFFLLPARLWEMAAGGLIYAYQDRANSLNPQTRRYLALTGIVMIFAAAGLFNSDMVWPGYAALLPVIGTSLIIFARYDFAFYGQKIIDALGKGSYSLYLWHWPFVVGISYFGFESGFKTQVTGIALSIFLAFLSYKFVETPLRAKSKSLSFILAIAVIPAVLGMAVDFGQGVPSRVSAQVLKTDAASKDDYKGDATCHFDKRQKQLDPCPVEKAAFAAWGDSHAGSIYSAVESAAGKKGVLYTFSCPLLFDTHVSLKGKDYPCPEYNDAVLASVKNLPAGAPIFIMNRYSYYLKGANENVRRAHGLIYKDISAEETQKNPEAVFEQHLEDSLCRVAKETKHPVYAIMPVPEMGKDVPKTLARQMMSGAKDVQDISIPRTEYETRHKEAISALKKAYKNCGIKIIDTTKKLCTDNICKGSTDLHPDYFDDDHLNETGNKKLIPLFKSVFSR